MDEPYLFPSPHELSVEMREAFIKEGGVGKALQGMGVKEIKVQRALATCLANLAQELDAAKEILSGFHLKQIIDWIGQGDEELTASSITILANASNHGRYLFFSVQNTAV